MPWLMSYSYAGSPKWRMLSAAMRASACASLRRARELNLARRGGQADLHGIGIAREHLRPLAPRRAVAFVNDNVAEVVFWVIGDQEVGVRLVGVHIQRLVGRDEDAGILLGSSLGDSRGIGAEDVLEGACRLFAQLVTVADEERAAELLRIGNALEQVHGDEGLARAGRQRQERALFATCQLFQHGANGGVLIVAPGCLATCVAREEWSRGRRAEAKADPPLVAGAHVVTRGELRQRAPRTCDAAKRAILAQEVPGGGED